MSADTLTVDPNLTFSTLETTVTATGVSVLASDDIKLVFVLTDAEGNEACRSTAVTVSQGTTSLETVSATIVLPEGLEQGKYTLALYAYTDDASNLTAANCPTALGRIVGHLAKFNGVYGLDDLTVVIDYLLAGTYPILKLDDVTAVIDVLLNKTLD